MVGDRPVVTNTGLLLVQDPTLLFRRNMTREDLKKIFDDPKPSERKGYHRASNGEKVERLSDVSRCKFRYTGLFRHFPKQ